MDTIAGKIKGGASKAGDLNIYQWSKKLAFKYIPGLAQEKGMISPEPVKNVFTAGIVQRQTILDVLKLHNEDLKKRESV